MALNRGGSNRSAAAHGRRVEMSLGEVMRIQSESETESPSLSQGMDGMDLGDAAAGDLSCPAAGG